MTKTKKTVAALLAVLAVGATAAAGAAITRNQSTAFAGTDAVSEVTPVAGSKENPVAAVAGANTISKMVVGGNAEMGYKELVYYMTFTPANSGMYNFTHSNPDIGVGEISSATDVPYGDWNEDLTVYSVELTANIEYTILVNNFDWNVVLDSYELGAEYALAAPETITIAYASEAAGSTRDNALPYNVGDTILVSAGHAPVWYSFSGVADTNYYLISLKGTASVNYVFRNNLYTLTEVTENYSEFARTGNLYICVTPTATQSAEIQILDQSKQTAGSCIVTAAAIPDDGIVGDGVWYTYTAAVNGSAALAPTADAYVVETEEGTVTLCGNVEVYEEYTHIGTLTNGAYVPAALPAEGEEVPSYANVTLTEGKTYRFYAPKYVYQESNEQGEIILTIDVYSKLTIG